MPKARPVTVFHADGRIEVVSAKAFKRKPYWKTPEWRKRRSATLTRDDHRCTHCGRRKGDEDPRLKADKRTKLEVHHLTYVRYKHERLEDLITLCQRCHATEHQWRQRETAAAA